MMMSARGNERWTRRAQTVHLDFYTANALTSEKFCTTTLQQVHNWLSRETDRRNHSYIFIASEEWMTRSWLLVSESMVVHNSKLSLSLPYNEFFD
jgi:hypothetical protein